MSLALVPFTKEYEEEALTLYNHYIATSTATFSIEPLKAEEMNKLIYSGLMRFPSFAILEEERFIGYALMNRYKPREAYDQTAEVTVYLKEEACGKGAGSYALSYLESFALNNDFHALLGVICEENKSSIALFKKMGYFECAHFREVGKKFNRLLDVVIYEKLL